jgi:phage regulator Rha-like protein
MTRDGFVLLAMGFTGKEALKWKIQFIEAFNAMEQALRQATIQEYANPKRLDKPKTTRITKHVVAYDDLFGGITYQRTMVRVETKKLNTPEKIEADVLNLNLQSAGCLKKANEKQLELDYLRQSPAVKLLR